MNDNLAATISTSNSNNTTSYSHHQPYGLHLHPHQMQQQSQPMNLQQLQQQLQDPQMALHNMKDANGAYDIQPRYYTSTMVLQQPSYFPQNSQYTFNQSGYPPNYQQPQQTQQVQLQQQQMQQQQQQLQQQNQQPLAQQLQQPLTQQQYFDNAPINNYMMVPNNTNAAPYSNTTPATNTTAAASTTTNGASSTPVPTNTSINTFYNANYNQAPPHRIPHPQVTNAPPTTTHASLPSNQVTTASTLPGANVANGNSNPAVLYPNFPERLQQLLPAPPLSRAQTRPDINLNLSQKRAKRKSKFSKYQDELIVSLKKKGKSWVEIAEATNVGSYLAARNRYQVIVGQQGNNNSSSWDPQDKVHLQQILDAGELEKWRFISLELNKATKKSFTPTECCELIRMMFWSDPASFGVNEDTISECLKEKKLTEKVLEQRDQHMKKKAEKSGFSSSEQAYVEPILNAKANKDLKKEVSNEIVSPTSSNKVAYQQQQQQQILQQQQLNIGSTTASIAPSASHNNVNSGNYFTTSANAHPHMLPHPYQRGVNGVNSANYIQNSATSNGAATGANFQSSTHNNQNQYTAYPKHYY